MTWVEDRPESLSPAQTPPFAGLDSALAGKIFAVHLAQPFADPRQLDAREGLPWPYPSPDGRYLAIARYAPNRFEVWDLRDPSRPLLTISEWRVGFSPQWSPDSHEIAFVLSASESTSERDVLWRYAVGRRSLRRLDGLNGAWEVATWLPDNRRLIALVVGRPWLVPTSDETAWPLPVSPTARVSLVGSSLGPHSFSPNGRLLAYSFGDNLILVLDLETGALQQFPVMGTSDQRVSWLGADTLIDADCNVINTRTGAVHQLIPGGCEYGIPSPNRQLVATSELVSYGLRSPSGAKLPMEFDVSILDRDTGARQTLNDLSVQNAAFVAWAPDSRHLLLRRVFCCGFSPVQSLLVDVRTGKGTALTPDLEMNSGAAFSPDGTRVLVWGLQLRLYGLDGQLLWWVNPGAAEDIRWAAWSGDGARIIYVTGPKGFACCE